MRFIKVFTIFIITLFILHPTVVCAKKKHQISVDVGLVNYTNRDDLASPLLYKGRQKTFGISYAYKGNKNWHWGRIGIMTGEIQTSSFTSSADHSYGQLQYGYARLLSGRANAKMTFWLGGSWDNMVSARDYSFTSSNYSSGTVPTGIAGSTLNINLLCDLLPFEKQRIVFFLSVPVVGYLLRNGYALHTPDITNRLTSVKDYQRFRFSVFFEHPFSAYFKLRFTYWFIYHRYSQPRKTISVFHGLSGGISFQF